MLYLINKQCWTKLMHRQVGHAWFRTREDSVARRFARCRVCRNATTVTQEGEVSKVKTDPFTTLLLLLFRPFSALNKAHSTVQVVRNLGLDV
jgi:hypothetical protein